MREVPTTEAGSRLAELLRADEHGESIAITRHGRPVAHLVSAGDHERALRKEAIEHREAQFVDDGERMASMLWCLTAARPADSSLRASPCPVET